MIKEIVTDEKLLAQPSYEIDLDKERELLVQIVRDLKDTLRATENAVGLAAIQIGYNKRVFVINFNGDIRTFINPMISRYSKPTWSIEGCLSIPGKRFAVLSFDEIEVFYQTMLGKNKSARLSYGSARAFQHEANHLNGLTIQDHGLEWTDDLDALSDEAKQALFIELAKTLEEKQKEKESEKDADGEQPTSYSETKDDE